MTKGTSDDIQGCVNRLCDELQRCIASVTGDNERLELEKEALRNQIEKMTNPLAGQRDLTEENARLKRQIADITSVEPLTGDDMRGEWRRLVANDRVGSFPQLMGGLAEHVNAHFGAGDESASAGQRDLEGENSRLVRVNGQLWKNNERLINEVLGVREQLAAKLVQRDDRIARLKRENVELTRRDKDHIGEIERLRRENKALKAGANGSGTNRA